MLLSVRAGHRMHRALHGDDADADNMASTSSMRGMTSEEWMFFVFGPSGQMYRGGPENLAQISPVRRVQRAQALRPRGLDVPAEPLASSTEAAPPAHAFANPRLQEALDTYAQAGQGPQRARHPLTAVRDVMATPAISVPSGASVKEAWQTLAAHQVAQAPVVNAQGRVVGLLLRGDMAPVNPMSGPDAMEQAIGFARRPASDVMVSPVPAVAADTGLRRVAAALLDTDLPGLPVTDEAGALLGFISRADILKAVAADPPLDLWSGPAAPM